MDHQQKSAKGTVPGEATPTAAENAIESFSPNDYSYQTNRPRQNGSRRRKKILLTIILGLALLLTVLSGIYVYELRTKPAAFFSGGTQTPSAMPTASPTPTPTTAVSATQAPLTPTPEPTAEPTEFDLLANQADENMMHNIINIALIGVDYAVERETWSGKHDYHADVIMVMAVNFDQKRVDLISIPRDTYANIPGVKGIYKINGSINCGGGFDAPNQAGFLKTCEAASWMLGGIPVDYFYAVTMPAVKELVDVFGGVDYDLELSFKMAGRQYRKGQQHMDGQGVLDYLRVRKNVSSSGDLNRINRQKEMLVALFSQMKQNNLIVKIPQILSSFDGQLFTNCSLSQTAALATFAYDMDPANIGMHSMDGRMTNIFKWNFVLTDQEKRVGIIRDVYGVDVPIERAYTATYAAYRWQAMLADQYIKTTTGFRETAQSEIRNGSIEYGGYATFDEGEIDEGWSDNEYVLGYPKRIFKAVPELRAAEPLRKSLYTQDGYSAYDSFMDAYDRVIKYRNSAAEEAEKYLAGEDNRLSSVTGSLRSANNDLKDYAIIASNYLGINAHFSWDYIYYKDKDFNEVYVDFR